MRSLSPAALACLLGSLASLPAQTFLSVPAGFPTIQSAIAAAVPGDTVIVAPGVYVETIDFLGKAIIVRSSDGAIVTAIDGNQAGSVVTFATGETAASVLQGFTIRNGRGATAPTRSRAGGIHCFNASPTIRSCYVTGNFGGAGAPGTTTTLGGSGGPGGIFAAPSALRLIDVQVTDNIGGDGGLGISGPFAVAGGRGGAGGAYFSFEQIGVNVEIERGSFLGNIAGRGGDAVVQVGSGISGRGGDGGIEMSTFSVVRFTGTVIAWNEGGDSGTPSGSGSVIRAPGGNGGFDLGSGVFGTGFVRLVSCAVIGNIGGDSGPGFNTYGGNGAGATGASAFTAVSTTFAGNVGGSPLISGAVTGGLRVGGFMVSSAALTNCILWGNLRGGLPSDLDVSGIVAQVNACDIGTSTGTVVGGGNLQTDPLFVNLAAGDVHLTAGSPCLHAGIVHALLPVFDFEGDLRTLGPATDMGADEYDGLVGSHEDFVLTVTNNGAEPASVTTVNPAPGDFVLARVWSPRGTLANDTTLVLAEVWLPPTPPVPPPLAPEMHVSLNAAFLAVYGGVGAGQNIGASVPPGLGGLALRLQAFCFSTAAKNGVLAASAARDVVF